MDKPKTDPNYKVIAENRRARFDYAIEDDLECGIVLSGSEVKSLRENTSNIAESYAEYRAARSLVYETARRMDLSATGQRVDADAAKLFAAQAAKRAADAAIQVLGGYGYMGENVVERLWRDAKLLEIGGGTLEAHHKNLAGDLGRDPSRIY